MTRTIKGVIAVTVAGIVLATSAGCDYIHPEADEVGLKYKTGSQDGAQFDKCIDPGKTETVVNDTIYKVPNNLRTWKISDVKDGTADSTDPIVVSSLPEENQPSGVQVNVWSQTNLRLNTNCDDDPNFKGGTLRRWWETIGHNNGGADTPDGWKKMMANFIVTSLTKATKDVIRSYDADDLVANKGGIYTDVQAKISAAFASELKRLTGGDFFCGPTFVRGKNACPAVELIVLDVDYNDPGIQDARNNKQKAIEQAAADLATATGQVNAANKLKELYANPAWVAIKLAELKVAQTTECAKTGKCVVVMDETGNVNLQVTGQ